MLAIPRVHLRGGRAIRPGGASPAGGEAVRDPVSVARAWANVGFRCVHVIDMDAVSGAGSNAMLVDDIVRDGALDIDVCDGAQSTRHIQQLLEAGAARVVVGPRALEDSDWITRAADLYPGLLVVATTVRERRTGPRGRIRGVPFDVLDVAHEMNGLPLGGLLVELSADGGLSGADLSMLEDLAEACPFPVIGSRAAASMNDLRALEHRGISAVLLSESLYSGELDADTVAREFGGSD